MIKHEQKTAIFETIGTASMCWSEPPTGIFDSTLAEKTGNELIQKLFPEKQDPQMNQHSGRLLFLARAVVHDLLETPCGPDDDLLNIENLEKLQTFLKEFE